MPKSTGDLLARIAEWLDAARAIPTIVEPTAMTLATVNALGEPSARVVLLKSYDANGFCFYTNNQSRKGHDMVENANVALCFYWGPLGRQLRIEGTVSPLGDAESDAYFSLRDRGSQLGAWASEQSRVMTSREELEARLVEYTAKYEGIAVPRPPHWSGWRVTPKSIEFWQQGAHRLHDRECYHREAGGWRMERLYP